MKTSPEFPLHLEDRKALKLIERIKRQIPQAKDIRETSPPTSSAKLSQSVA
jgi:hypothetical protein